MYSLISHYKPFSIQIRLLWLFHEILTVFYKFPFCEDFGPKCGQQWSQNDPKSGPSAPQKLSTSLSGSKKYAGADSEVEKAGCGAGGADLEPFLAK